MTHPPFIQKSLDTSVPTTQVLSQSETVRRHYQSPEVGVTIPLLQSLVTGFLVGLCATGVAWGVRVQFQWDWGNPLVWGVLVFVFTTTIFWLIRLAFWSSMVEYLETVLQADINRDGEIGQPVPHTGRVLVEVDDKGDNSTKRQLIPTTPRKLKILAEGLLKGIDFTEDEWTGSSGIFSQAEFRGVRDAFIKQGWAAWNNPEFHNQGVAILAVGKRVLQVIANMSVEEIEGQGAPTPPY